jgi:hypothetical protein
MMALGSVAGCTGRIRRRDPGRDVGGGSEYPRSMWCSSASASTHRPNRPMAQAKFVWGGQRVGMRRAATAGAPSASLLGSLPGSAVCFL